MHCIGSGFDRAKKKMGHFATQLKTASVNQRRAAILLLAGITVCFAVLKLGSVYGFLFFPDEFCYWSYAAKVQGYDWSAITSQSSYYSYGYALLLWPVFALCRDGVWAYRAAVGLNYVFLLGAGLLLIRTVPRFWPDGKGPLSLFCVLAILTPWNLLYGQVTMTESLVVSLYAAVGCLFYRYLENEGLPTLLLLVLTLAYLYTVHMRTVGVLLSATFVLLLHIARNGKKKWHIAVFLGLLALLLIGAALLKERAMSELYASADPTVTADNDYAGQLEKLRYICTGEGFYDFLITVLGGFLYLGLATFGLFYWGICGLVRAVWRMLRAGRKGKTAAQGEMSLFLLLAVPAQIVIASVYLLKRGEIDDYTYGRYSEFVLPFLIVVGFSMLWEMRRRAVLAVTACLALFQALGLWLLARQIAHTGTQEFLGFFMVGISYLYRGGFEAGRFYVGAWLLCELFTILTLLLVWMSRGGGRGFLLTAFAVLELSLALHADSLYFMGAKKAAFRDSRLAEKVRDMSGQGREAVYINPENRSYLCILQFMDRDTKIRILDRRERMEDYEEEISEETVLIFSYDDEFSREWAERYDREDTYGHFTVLYNK